MSVAAGRKRHWLTLHAPAGTRGTGAAVDLETGIAAQIEAVPLEFQQAERLAAGGLNVQTLYSIVMQYRADVDHDLQLREECCTQRTFHIQAMIPSDRLDEWQITAVVSER